MHEMARAVTVDRLIVSVSLSSLQMFVRLFVDENLDRVSPISKQPKDKIQAILEACDRQFPEFHVRSRKRIRTYLKSCRRLRRCKDRPESPQVGGFILDDDGCHTV